jgi:hypothetical protein
MEIFLFGIKNAQENKLGHYRTRSFLGRINLFHLSSNNVESEKEVNVGLAAKPDQTNPSVQAALDYIIDTGGKAGHRVQRSGRTARHYPYRKV